MVIYTKADLRICISGPKFNDANCLRLDRYCYSNNNSDLSITIFPKHKQFSGLFEKHYNNMLNQHCVLIGDINLNTKDNSIDNRAKEHLSLIAHYGYVPEHNISIRGHNCLDHCLIKSSQPSTTIVGHSDITYYSSVLCSINSISFTKNLKQLSLRSITRAYQRT